MAKNPKNNRYSEVRIEDWDHARALLATFPGTWMFRGQKTADWPLMTAFERLKGFRHGAEEHIVREFKKRAHQYLPSQLLPSNSLEWLALMQHHGAPTRLLDCTFSRYVASFFALEDAEGDSAVWAIDYLWCRH